MSRYLFYKSFFEICKQICIATGPPSKVTSARSRSYIDLMENNNLGIATAKQSSLSKIYVGPETGLADTTKVSSFLVYEQLGNLYL